MPTYIHERPDWPEFRWRLDQLAEPLAAARHRQGLLAGRMQALGFRRAQDAVLDAMTEEVHKSSEIEGERLDWEQVRSSVARRLGIDAGALTPADRRTEGLVEMMLDATQHYSEPLSAERLFGWHTVMFLSGRGWFQRITVGAWRDDSLGPMQAVSGAMGRERVHYQAPGAARIEREMAAFLAWFNGPDRLDPVLKAALVHLWFVTIHPFDDGNGRIARAIADMCLARAERSCQRFYSMSAQIRKERKAYYDILEGTQKGDLDITEWMHWFLGCLDRAIQGAEGTLDAVLAKTRFWDSIPDGTVNERQRLVLGKVLDGLEGNLTTRRWATMAKCSHDTALRDIHDLIGKGVLTESEAGGRSTSYRLRPGDRGPFGPVAST